MIRSFTTAGALGFALLAGVTAHAQQRATAPQVLGGPTAPAAPFLRPVLPQGGLHYPGAPNDPYRAADLERRVYAERLTRQAIAEEPPARVQRANRVGYLIDQGQCGPAAQLARAEHDNRMADQVPVACKAHRYGIAAQPGGVPFGF